MRRIQHPGPSSPINVHTASSRYRVIQHTLKAGQTLLQGLNELMQSSGVTGAVARLGTARLFPVTHVLPALSNLPEYAVYYSERHDAHAPLRLTEATVTLGMRDGDRWLHCHARWLDEEGQFRCGHLLPDHTTLADDLGVELVALLDASFEAIHDPETNFALFTPSVCASDQSVPATGTGIAVRLGPNIDLCEGLLMACRKHGFSRAKVYGGVGSTVGAVFTDGRVVEPFVTELLIRSAVIDTTTGKVDIEIALIDYTGEVAEGQLAIGENPVLVTCECVIVPI
jgi:predicted DNA-binding protein with PD1-like motif